MRLLSRPSRLRVWKRQRKLPPDRSPDRSPELPPGWQSGWQPLTVPPGLRGSSVVLAKRRREPSWPEQERPELPELPEQKLPEQKLPEQRLWEQRLWELP